MAKLCAKGKAAAKRKFKKSTHQHTLICMQQAFVLEESHTKKSKVMAKKGLKEWVKEKWVDIANPRADGTFPPCARAKGEKRKIPKKCTHC